MGSTTPYWVTVWPFTTTPYYYSTLPYSNVSNLLYMWSPLVIALLVFSILLAIVFIVCLTIMIYNYCQHGVCWNCCCRNQFTAGRRRRRRIVEKVDCADDVITVGKPRNHRVVTVDADCCADSQETPVTFRCVESVPAVTACLPEVESAEERARRLRVTVHQASEPVCRRQCHPALPEVPLVHCPVRQQPIISEIRFAKKDRGRSCHPSPSISCSGSRYLAQGSQFIPAQNSCSGGGGTFRFTISGVPASDGASRRRSSRQEMIGNIQIVPDRTNMSRPCFSGADGGGGMVFNLGAEGNGTSRGGNGNSFYPNLSGGSTAQFEVIPAARDDFLSYPTLPEFYD